MNLRPTPALLLVLLALAARSLQAAPAPVTLESLLAEMTDPAAVARQPSPAYRMLQASSYNRESVHRDRPGWFADSDGLGFVREEDRGSGRGREWVILEHEGPGCLTKFWTPYFYFNLNDHTGPRIRIYLDGAEEPFLDEGFIDLVTGKGSVKPPFAAFTARAGNVYLPIPFARGCRVTLSGKPFYHLVNYRAYAPGTPVETLTRERLAAAASRLAATGDRLYSPPRPDPAAPALRLTRLLKPGASARLALPRGPGAVRAWTLQVPDAATRPELLRSTVLSFTFDGEETVWCPLGDFFDCADAVHPHQTWQRSVWAGGLFASRWVMPYARSARLRILNLGTRPVDFRLEAELQPWTWDERSLHFHARWRPDEVVPGTPFRDWTFIDVQGSGVYVGDTWTVLNLQRNTWWGEGDEKIYVDDAWNAGFPTHFGTGTEDYYGWAGGELPTRADEFDEPFVANVRVGGLDGHTQGFNICTRTRVLDAIPFTQRLRFDMESSFGTDIRNPWDLLGYSAVTFWYARPGARTDLRPRPDAAARPIPTVEDLRRESEVRRRASPVPAR